MQLRGEKRNSFQEALAATHNDVFRDPYQMQELLIVGLFFFLFPNSSVSRSPLCGNGTLSRLFRFTQKALMENG